MHCAKDLALIALLTILLFIQEQVLVFLPNIQLTIFFLVLYSKKVKLIDTVIICVLYVILDNIFGGYFNLLFIIFMLIGWLIIPLSLNTIFKKVESNIILAILGILYALIYSWVNMIPSCIVFQMDPITYLLGDIIWEVLLAVSSFLSILILYNPCARIFDIYINKKRISS